MDLDKYLDFAIEATWQAGRITLGYFQRPMQVEVKGDRSPVTIADRQAEKLLRELIARAWPDHGVLGEEYGEIHGRSEFRWVIDPIDGTKSFIAGVPLYATLIALLHGETSLVGVIHLPALNETICARRGGGCRWNGRLARVSTVNDLPRAVLLSSNLDLFETTGKQAAWQRLRRATYLQRTWGDAYGYALVATGRAEVMLDAKMSVWDCGPLQVILEEAGGTFTDWGGRATAFGDDAIATNGLLFDQVMELVGS